MARTVTRGQVKTRAQQLADVVGDGNVTDAELTELFNLHLTAVYDILVGAGYASYYSSTQTVTTAVGTSAYSLPADFLQATGVYFVDSNGYRQPIYSLGDRQRGNYRAPTGVYQVELEYVPACPVLATDNDAFDGVSGWDELVSARIARDVLVKRQGDTGMVANIIATTEKRIRSNSTRRDAGGPRFIDDVENTAPWWALAQARLTGYRLRGASIELWEPRVWGLP